MGFPIERQIAPCNTICKGQFAFQLFSSTSQCTDMPYQTHRYPLSDTSIERCFFLISRRAVTLLKASLNWRTIFTTSLSMSITTCSTMIGVPSVFQCVLCYGNWFAKANQLKPYIYSEVYLSSIDSFHQFVWCKYLHLGETKPLFTQVLYGSSYMIHIIVYTKEAVM